MAALIGSAVGFSISPLAAQDILPPPEPAPLLAPSELAVAVVSYGSGGSVVTHCMTGMFELAGVQPGETLQVTIYYPADKALQVADIEALDGGSLFPPPVEINPPPPPCDDCGPIVTPAPIFLSLVINAEGAVSFTFVPGDQPGLRQVTLRQGGQEVNLQLWVFDPENPDTNPPALVPETNIEQP